MVGSLPTPRRLGRGSLAAFPWHVLVGSALLVVTACAPATGSGAPPAAEHAPLRSAVSAPTSQLAAPAPAREAVTVAANSTSVNHYWAYWGVERGIYARHGLEVSAADNVGDPSAALVAEHAQFAAHGVQLHSAAVKGLDVRVVMITNRDNLGVFAEPSIAGLAGLRGKRIVNPYDPLKEVFRRQGWDPESDVTWIVSRSSRQHQLEMVRQGEADAVAGFPPMRLLGERMGLRQVFAISDLYPGVPVAVVGTSTRLIDQRPDLVKRMIAATLDTLQDMRDNREALVARMMDAWGFDRELAEASYETVNQDLILNGQVADELLQLTLDATKSGQGSTADIALGQVWDFRLLREVLQERGPRG